MVRDIEVGISLPPGPLDLDKTSARLSTSKAVFPEDRPG